MICMHNCTDCKRKLSITARDRGPQHGRRSRFVRPNLASEPGMQRVHVGITPTSSSSCRHHHSNSHLRCRSLGPLDWANARSGPCSLADLGVPPHLLMGVPSPRCTHAQGYRYFCFLSLLSHNGRIATGRAVGYAQREDDVPVALKRPRQSCRRDRSRCGDGGHARGGHTMATGVSVQHHHASVRPTLGRKGCNHVVHSGNHVVHDRRGIGDRRAPRGPRECPALVSTCATSLQTHRI